MSSVVTNLSAIFKNYMFVNNRIADLTVFFDVYMVQNNTVTDCGIAVNPDVWRKD